MRFPKTRKQQENNKYIDYSDGFDIEEPIWDYQTLTSAQQQGLPSSVLEKVGKLFVDR